MSIHILVLKVSRLRKHILFQRKSKLVSFHFINHLKLYNDKKKILWIIKMKVKQVHVAGCNVVFLVVFSVFGPFSIFFNIKKVQHENSAA